MGLAKIALACAQKVHQGKWQESWDLIQQQNNNTNVTDLDRQQFEGMGHVCKHFMGTTIPANRSSIIQEALKKSISLKQIWNDEQPNVVVGIEMLCAHFNLRLLKQN